MVVKRGLDGVVCVCVCVRQRVSPTYIRRNSLHSYDPYSERGGGGGRKFVGKRSLGGEREKGTRVSRRISWRKEE